MVGKFVSAPPRPWEKGAAGRGEQIFERRRKNGAGSAGHIKPRKFLPLAHERRRRRRRLAIKITVEVFGGSER